MADYTSIRIKNETLLDFNQTKKEFNSDDSYKHNDFLIDLLACFKENTLKEKTERVENGDSFED